MFCIIVDAITLKCVGNVEVVRYEKRQGCSVASRVTEQAVVERG